MNIQSDIKWIQRELMNVTDPELISAFKSLLKYRKNQSAKQRAFDLSFDRAISDKKRKAELSRTKR